MKTERSTVQPQSSRTQLKQISPPRYHVSIDDTSPLPPKLRSPDRRGFNSGETPLYRFHGIDQLNEMKRQHALKHALKLKEIADDKARLIELSPKPQKERTRKILEKAESTARATIESESKSKWNSKFQSNWGAEWNPEWEKPQVGYASSDSFPPPSDIPSLCKTVHIAPYGVDFVEDTYPTEPKSPAA
jgi:hypothetical protein